MPFSKERTDEIQRGIQQLLATSALSGWERKFLYDMESRFEQHGTRTRLSSRQYKSLVKLLFRKLPPSSSPRTKNILPMSDRRPSRSARARSKEPAPPSWYRLLSTGLFAALGAAYLCFLVAERAPEYFGFLVRATSSRTVSGPVTHVRDGDTIEVSRIPIRFGSLDCAERDTAQGQRATAHMRSLISGENLTCYLNGRTSYDRMIGSCTLQDGRDLAGIMIKDGYCTRFW